MNLKLTFVIAAVLGIAAISAWELYWRGKGYYPDLNDNKELWAVQRAKAEKADKDIPIFVGSSRILFGIQLDAWEHLTGTRPIQLAGVGSSPLPIFHDMVEHTSFSGTIFVDITPGLFFSTTYPKAQPWAWPQARVDYDHKRTYAQKINHYLSLPLQKNLALMSAGENANDDDIDLKSLLRRIKIGNRTQNAMPPFHSFADIAEDRNVRMRERMVTDTAYANSVKKVWLFYGKTASELPPPDKEGTINFFLNDLKKFQARGGRVILIRFPSDGGVLMGEDMGLPRKDYWDVLVERSGLQAYYFKDYPTLSEGYQLPEWSHLSPASADKFTKELVKILQKDGVIHNPKKQ
jgi:hypothetical protein